MSRLNSARLYGLLWFVAGCMLVCKGMPLLVKSAICDDLPLIRNLKLLFGSAEQSALVLVFLALGLGFLKSRLVLAKAANRMVARLDSLSEPVAVKQLFTLRYCLILALMVLLGTTLRFCHLAYDIHGLIDLAIGSALIYGSRLYFRRKATA